MASFLKQFAVLAVLAGGAWVAADRYVLNAPETAQEARRERPAPGVVVEAARLDTVERAVAAVGTGRAARSVVLRVSDDGRVTEILFRAGDAVRQGEPLVTLDEARELAALAEAEAALTEARAAFERAETLASQGRVTSSALDTARNDLGRAEARHDRARTDLELRTLRAPFDGVVGFTDIHVGAFVTAATAIATLDDLTFIDADFAVPERFFGEVQPGDAVRAQTDARPGEVFTGQVAAIDRRVDEATRSFRVRARFANPDLRLPAGAFMRVELVLESREGVIAPEEAVVTEGGATFVYVVNAEDTVERRAVTVGARRAGEAEIVEGLAEGERVVVRGVQKVRPGAPVRIMGGGAPETGAQPQARQGERGSAPAPAAPARTAG